ncbi:MAG: hypothetical protein Ta2E_01500 [Mycoplasmoidaceae bacterium]|nr:MAG: hypothetical protein Ta2E_01500 [Mycoplasmoidaceae bacterium]
MIYNNKGNYETGNGYCSFINYGTKNYIRLCTLAFGFYFLQ